jgi:hypothetical protein
MMSEPLTKSQQRLRGRKVQDMSVDELNDWISACDRMEVWVSHNKARRSWNVAREDAQEELARRIGETD